MPIATHMPRITIKTGIVAADGQEEVITEFLCDWPDCPNVAEHVLGVVRELGMMRVVCQEHAVMPRRASDSGDY